MIYSVATASHIHLNERSLMKASFQRDFLLNVHLLRKTKFLVPMRLGDTPVPIPNTTVKTQAADGTALETVWESRWAPDQTGV